MLFEPKTPPPPAGIDLRLGTVEDMIKDLEEAGVKSSLIVADPPWSYGSAPGSMNPAKYKKDKFRPIGQTGVPKYSTLTMAEIAATMASTYAISREGSRLVVWCTWPQLGDWMAHANALRPWKYVTGGTWNKETSKDGGGGMGWHWLGRCEPVLVYRRGGKLTNRFDTLTNNWSSPAEAHSVKPWKWMANWLLRWTNPGELVVDVYAGLGPLAVACYATGRAYVGAEIDPDRRHHALCRLGQFKCTYDQGFYNGPK